MEVSLRHRLQFGKRYGSQLVRRSSVWVLEEEQSRLQWKPLAQFVHVRCLLAQEGQGEGSIVGLALQAQSGDRR